MAHQSDSLEQRSAEAEIRKKVAVHLGIERLAAKVMLEGGTVVQVDGVSADEAVFVEIFAHQGPSEGRSASQGGD